ncbi:secreted RxLR effector protein 161-like [Corylus avellana]|uniref:secreted RxLR effector protein 161-like n=1 Tax=Corylus avellana TaxID=13451 RepID=UPI00286C3B97|nr:secreted RxLR effector protein 161-like [Corylus avellana]
MIESLIYLTASKLDISLSVGVCTRFQANPKESHLTAIKRNICYDNDTVNYGIWYSKNTNLNLAGYSDVDRASCVVDRRSTSGGCFYVGTNLVAWLSMKQNSISPQQSASSCCTYLLWMKKLLADYGLDQEKMVVFCDNQSVLGFRLA